MRWQPVHNTRLHARLPLDFLVMEAWMTSQLNVSFVFLSYSLTGYPGVFFQPGTDRRLELNICTVSYIQYRHLIPAPVDRTSVRTWSLKHLWITCHKVSQVHQ